MNSVNSSRDGLRFFGRISASISHEIKNVFAVINESAGLIKDLALMAGQGEVMQPEKVASVASSIQGQIHRGDSIVKNMNAFAHSIDDMESEVDLVCILDLTLALATRFADMAQVKLLREECKPISMTVSLFDLIQLLHAAILTVVEVMTAGETLVVRVIEENGNVLFVFSPTGKNVPKVFDVAFSSLAQTMGVCIRPDENEGIVELVFLVSNSA